MSELFATPKSMKKVILRGIRTTLLELGSATKVELSEKLGISFPTISKFLSQMEKDGELTLVGLDDSSGGRRAKRYAYNPEYMLGLAIFLERKETNYTIFNCLGKVKEQGQTKSVLLDDIQKLTSHIEDLLKTYPKIGSIAIGVPGSVDHDGRIFFIPGYEQFQNVDLKKYYEDHFSIPVVVENDMNAAVLGYHNRMEIENNQSLIYLYFGQNGPGAGIMINGDVVRGSTFFSGEVSFVPQYDNQNFLQAMQRESGSKQVTFLEQKEIDAISRLVASFVAIINPHTIIFCKDEVNQVIIDQIAAGSSTYIPVEHLPGLAMSDWKQDYLFGLQSLGLDLLIAGTSR
ncbi:ROK family transcriptional regulator [Bacillus sp. SA1-12]|uniref:ROK family transcriptional regulator n=1 Tax=Bacillus sp. SA1-12 TaxID=1455638 RepID=UPI000626458C|nr:ROK family transcriptional regulator [Bacillus sp. SA1-12]KKI92920.1 ROK family transcriptional regulator [Bacillus sp. SA1-12]